VFGQQGRECGSAEPHSSDHRHAASVGARLGIAAGHNAWVQTRRVAMVGVLIGLLSACSGGGSTGTAASIPTVPYAGPVPTTNVVAQALPAGPVAHAIDVARGIRAAGLGCMDANLLPRPEGAPGRPTLVTEQVTCPVSTEASVTISTFADHASLAKGLVTINDEVCARKPRPVNLSYAAGDNWIIFPEQRATARMIASALPATLGAVRC
jgi:hypothetical protein